MMKQEKHIVKGGGKREEGTSCEREKEIKGKVAREMITCKRQEKDEIARENEAQTIDRRHKAKTEIGVE